MQKNNTLTPYLYLVILKYHTFLTGRHLVIITLKREKDDAYGHIFLDNLISLEGKKIHYSFVFRKELLESNQILNFTRFFLREKGVLIFSYYCCQTITSDLFKGSMCGSSHPRIGMPFLGYL